VKTYDELVAATLRKEFGTRAAAAVRDTLDKVRSMPDYVRNGEAAQLVLERGKRVLKILLVDLH
jgi:hypothetical protein